jgi:hypothetical protein
MFAVFFSVIVTMLIAVTEIRIVDAVQAAHSARVSHPRSYVQPQLLVSSVAETETGEIFFFIF